jgi:tetratricopeptide (TPR) repeat protein
MSKKDLPDFNILWDYGNPAATGEKFSVLLPLAENAGDNSYLAELLTQIARTEGLQMHFDEAHKILDRADTLITDDMHLARIRYLLERGRAYNSSKVYDKAKENFLRAYNLALEKKLDFYTIDAAHMMGIVEKGDESLRWNEIAMKHAESSDDKKAKGWLGSLYNNTGWTYHDMGEYEKALDLFEKNVVWHTERNSKQGLIIAKWCVGKTLRSLGRIQQAFDKQKALYKEIKLKKMREDGYNNEEIGECLLLLNRKDESKKYFKKAFTLLSQDIWFAENEKDRLDRLKKLSK